MMKKTSLILALAVMLVAVAGAAYAVEGEEEVSHILKLLKPVLDMIVGFIGDILNEFVKAIQNLLGLGGGSTGGVEKV